jgi:hypothetical protein
LQGQGKILTGTIAGNAILNAPKGPLVKPLKAAKREQPFSRFNDFRHVGIGTPGDTNDCLREPSNIMLPPGTV